jgi:hypothetical protein
VPVVAGGLTLQRRTAAPERTNGSAATRAPSIDCELVTCSLRLEELEEDWRELWSLLPDATPFQSPDWLLPWWKHYGEGQLFSLAFWDGARLVGLAPLQIFESAADPTRRLFLLGTGNSDYLDALFHPAWRRACCNALMAEIAKRSDCWDVCSFQRLRPGSPFLEETDEHSGFRVEQAEQVPCVAVDLQNLGHGAVMLRRSQSYARKLQGSTGTRLRRPSLQLWMNSRMRWNVYTSSAGARRAVAGRSAQPGIAAFIAWWRDAF